MHNPRWFRLEGGKSARCNRNYLWSFLLSMACEASFRARRWCSILRFKKSAPLSAFFRRKIASSCATLRWDLEGPFFRSLAENLCVSDKRLLLSTCHGDLEPQPCPNMNFCFWSVHLRAGLAKIKGPKGPLLFLWPRMWWHFMILVKEKCLNHSGLEEG